VWLGYACGTCKYCLTGWETLCPSQQNTGYSVAGCYAEYFLAEAAFAKPVPAMAYSGLRRGGRLVLVALPASGTLRIPVFDTVLNGTSVIGSIVGTRSDLIDVFALQRPGGPGELRDQAAGLRQRGHRRGAVGQGEGTAGP